MHQSVETKVVKQTAFVGYNGTVVFSLYSEGDNEYIFSNRMWENKQ